MSATAYKSTKSPAVSLAAQIGFTVAIALIGWVMMTVTSSPTVKGASFLWLPAALQLVAGVWFGPVKGFLVGGIGAYAAGILAYGGWGTVDIIMNLIAGGFANATLPALLFQWFKVDPTFGVRNMKDMGSGLSRIMLLTVLVLLAGAANIFLKLPGMWGFLLPFLAVVIGARLIFRGLPIDGNSLILGIAIAVTICAVSALIGVFGAMVGGKPFAAALLDPGIGWFLGDTVSAILGLYVLAAYTQRARDTGITSN